MRVGGMRESERTGRRAFVVRGKEREMGIFIDRRNVSIRQVATFYTAGNVIM